VIVEIFGKPFLPTLSVEHGVHDVRLKRAGKIEVDLLWNLLEKWLLRDL